MKANFFRAFLALTIVLIMVSCSSNSSDGISTNKSIITTYNYNETESKLIILINNYRQSIGLNTLDVINHISFKSEEHNIYMIEHNLVNHDYFQQRSDNLILVLGAERVGENIAYNYKTAENAFSAWMNSPGHRANIEGDYTHFGIAVTTDDLTGKKYYTNMFIKKKL
ncbi:MAG: CAP domain-containing protein [Flavobacterium sp.]|nr:CAP domain-containing protein [Flavobacterium sp.]